MPNLKVKNLDNKDVGEISLSDEVFAVEVNTYLLHEVVRMQRNRKRAGTACTKGRNAVAGGGQKPFRQKGTGRARQGTLTAPNHRGGGTVFGPSPRSYDFSPPKKVRRGAMKSALSLFCKEERLVVVEDFELKEMKTKALSQILGKIGADKAILVDDKENDNLKMSARNLAEHMYLPPEGLNVYDLLKHDKLVISKRAVEKIQESLLRPVREKGAVK
ncbi:MAG: 50S ribosomal protein L4 [Deltaproteobacteria bacterium]|nr:50S ribosomal protein L4 [Deltaproteobacteria bacterium]